MTVWGGYETAVEDEGSCRRADGGGCASHDRLTLIADSPASDTELPLTIQTRHRMLMVR